MGITNFSTSTVAGLGSGLKLIKTQTIGTTVSSVVVTGAFSSTYDNYKIIVTGGSSSVGVNGADIRMQLGNTTTGYYSNLVLNAYAGGAFDTQQNNAANWTVGRVGNFGHFVNIDILSPNTATYTTFGGMFTQTSTTQGAGHIAGYINNQTQYTDFTLSPNSGTVTGGTIFVYGYQKA